MIDKQKQDAPRRPLVQRSALARFFMIFGLPGTTQRIARTESPIVSGDDPYSKANRFLLRVVQPGLAGLMDGSVSTLAPIFAAALASHKPFFAFVVGMAAATGAGISMAFSEALSDDGKLTGRGNPIARGAITGFMTFLGGTGHTLPFLIPDLHVALIVAYCVVAVELMAIAAIRHRYFGINWPISILQVIGGGLLVVAAGFLFGNA